MRTRHLNGLLIVAVLAISTAPLLAQGAQPDAAKLKADARNVVGIIGSDKAKTQAYRSNCEHHTKHRSETPDETCGFTVFRSGQVRDQLAMTI
jgi:hypothetical protein